MICEIAQRNENDDEMTTEFSIRLILIAKEVTVCNCFSQLETIVGGKYRVSYSTNCKCITCW